MFTRVGCKNIGILKYDFVQKNTVPGIRTIRPKSQIIYPSTRDVY